MGAWQLVMVCTRDITRPAPLSAFVALPQHVWTLKACRRNWAAPAGVSQNVKSHTTNTQAAGAKARQMHAIWPCAHMLPAEQYFKSFAAQLLYNFAIDYFQMVSQAITG